MLLPASFHVHFTRVSSSQFSHPLNFFLVPQADERRKGNSCISWCLLHMNFPRHSVSSSCLGPVETTHLDWNAGCSPACAEVTQLALLSPFTTRKKWWGSNQLFYPCTEICFIHSNHIYWVHAPLTNKMSLKEPRVWSCEFGVRCNNYDKNIKEDVASGWQVEKHLIVTGLLYLISRNAFGCKQETTFIGLSTLFKIINLSKSSSNVCPFHICRKITFSHFLAVRFATFIYPCQQ